VAVQARRRKIAIFSGTILVALLVIAALFLTTASPTKSLTATETMGESVSASENQTTMTVNGSSYYADNVTSVMVSEDPGFFHFSNGSVTFLGVQFTTICTSFGGGCPVPPPPQGSTFTVPTGPGITLNVTFPDHTSETIVGAFPMLPSFSAFTHHTNPQAGILIVYDESSSIFKSYLLVSTANSSTSSTGVSIGACGQRAQTIVLNATGYCAEDVANDTVLGSPGYSYFLNGSITFMGVTFQTYCPSEYRGCPGANSSASIVTLGIMRFTMTFSDKTNETVTNGAIDELTYIPILSNHTNPRAGMLIVITNGANETTDHVFLLVEAPGGGTSSSMAVATLTETETLTTQDSQATTTIETTNTCTLMPFTITTMTTTTVFAPPPESTTTVTVTTTSTSYTQTVTVTSCTFSASTVTSTITTTASA
jgi:hypothetical protein